MGRKDEIIERVRAVAEPLAGQEGLELIDVQLGGSGRTELTLFIDKLPGGAGVFGPSVNMAPASDADPHQLEASLLGAHGNRDADTLEDSPLSLAQVGDTSEEHRAADAAESEDSEELEDPEGAEPSEDSEDLEGSEALSIEIETPSPGMRPGVTLDDCANFSRIVSAALDVEDPLDGAYELVVSSPGLDRPLRTPAHYQRYVGKRVRVKTYAPVPDAGNRKTFVGNLLGYDEAKGAVLIDVDGTHFAVPRQAISKANLDPVFDI